MHETKPEVSPGVEQDSQLSSIAFKAPIFGENNTELGFYQVESQFVISGISNDSIKFHAVTAALNSNVLSCVRDTVKNPPLKNAYTVEPRLANCWASASTLLINKPRKNLLPNFIDSEIEENVQTEEIQLAALINQLQNTNPMSNNEALQWAAEVDYSLAPNEILTDDEIIRMVTAEDDDDDDVTPVNPVKISHSEAVVVLNTSLQWVEEQNFEALENMPLRRLRDRAFELKIGTVAQKNNDFFGH
ncbi:hypothetical protein AVEN_27887-1 [Araneus ventricosus]|uniref:DUF7041 domain-containing protein n=1 Tax=Araneus ventricosus TaxID=182803 RepID=A0A4Y2MC45_ARAVE|nr:hypothetical protein AVEN_27887-1 [Araneus ventricosus]